MDNTSQKTYQNTQSKGHLIKQEISKYFRYWPFVVGSVIIALFVVFMHLRYTKKQYKSNAKIKILSSNQGLELPKAGFIFSRPNINLENNIEIIKSSKLWQELVVEQDLVTSFYEEGNFLLTEISGIPFNYELKIPQTEIKEEQIYRIEVRTEGLFIFINKEAEAQIFPEYTTETTSHNLPFELSNFKSRNENIGEVYEIKLTPIATMADRLRRNFSVSVVGKNSELLELSFEGEIKSKSERILNGLMDVFELNGIRLRQTISERTINFIQDRFKVLANELDSIESGIKDFKVANKMLSVETKAASDLTKVSLSEEALVQLEAQLLVLDFIKNTINEPLEQLEILPSFMGESDINVSAQIKAYNELVLQMERLKNEANSNNPLFQELKRELESLKQSLTMSLKLMEVQLKGKKNELIAKNNEYSASLLEIPNMEKYMRDIERQQKIKETLYLFLLQKREEAAINKAITESDMQVVEFASSEYYPISPNPKNLYSLAVILGLAVPLGFIYLFLFFDTKVKTLNDIKSKLEGLPVLGEIPFVKNKNNVLVTKGDNSVTSESFRILSSNLSFVLPVKETKEAQIVLSTSTIKGEGKTFISVNLSLTLSALGKRVLLIGADLRNPQIHKALGVSKNESGLSELLHVADTHWKDLIKQMDAFENLDIILAGPIPPNAPQLLNNGRLEDLLKKAKLEYDYIIIDSAPTLLVSDTMFIAPLVDLTLFVARYNYTDKELLNFSKEMNQTGKINNIAFVLNGAETKKTYGYGYNYGYGYGYGSKN